MSNYFKNLRQEVYRVIPNCPQRILEIGCGEGEFSINFNEEFIEYWGVDSNKEAIEIAGSKLDKAFCGTFNDFENQLPDSYFDLIVCNDVIEHMTDAEDFVVKIKFKIKEGGFLVGSLPNVRHYSVLKNLLINGDWKYEDQGILDRTHFIFFTKKSLMRMFTNAGYRVDFIDGINKKYPSNKFLAFFSKIVPDEFLWQQFAFRLSIQK
jgi:2-polyprenyl-3-methyl-5-hydroxy-6-metoxy-1,4-benzoquinol methylase